MVAKSKKNGLPKQQIAKAETAAVPETAVAEPVTPAVAVAPEAKAPQPEAPQPAAAKSAAPKPAASKAAKALPPEAAFFGFDGLPGFGREDVAALARANAALVKGFEELGQEVAGFAQQNMTQAVDAARALVGVRTISDLVAINRNLAQAALDSAIANSARLSEIGIRVASEAFGPLNEQVATTFGRLVRPVG